MNRPVQSRQSENADPHEQYNPIPRIVILVILALLAWAVYYIVSAQPNSSPRLGDQRPLAVLAPAPGSASADGKQLYANACVACHQATGQGLPGVFPPLADSEWVKGDPKVLAQLVLHGVTGAITVKGQEYQGAMPAFAEQFSDAELAAVLSFIRHEWGNEEDAITSEFVAEERAASGDRSQPWQGEKELLEWIAAH